MKEVIKTPGKHVEYETTSKSIIFGDDDLSINLKNREKDEAVTIDVCKDRDGNLTMGTAAGLTYVAQVEIPARQYTEEEGEPDEDGNPTTTRVPVAFDIDNCTIYLWGMED
jgi:hypothetical protein